jgi:hypothetical protein
MASATVNPGQLDFYTGLTDDQQILGVTVTGEDVIISVPAAPAGDFSWDPSPAAGWELRKREPTSSAGGTVGVAEPLPPPSFAIRVRFTPSSPNEVHGTLTVNATKNDVARTPIPNFPRSVPLRGNVGGVGPGTLKITKVNANPVGPDLGPGPDQEYVEIINISGSQLDLNGCRVGDIVFGVHGGERDLLRFTNSFTLAPMGGAGTPKRLRIYTGTGAGVPADPSIDQIALNRGSPVWNNAGDIAWIKNASNQYVDRYSTFPAWSGGSGSNPPTTAPRTTTTLNFPSFVVPPTTAFMSTGITVEEADLLSFSASGQIWTSPGLERSTGPDGTSTDPAPLGWGPADAPPYSLIGRIGSGSPFYIGPLNSKVVRNDGGMLFLGINDPIPQGNWGSGFVCDVSLMRTT